jgi:hypothetical protein
MREIVMTKLLTTAALSAALAAGALSVAHADDAQLNRAAQTSRVVHAQASAPSTDVIQEGRASASDQGSWLARNGEAAIQIIDEKLNQSQN